ncbi:hypothetical protein EV122DRAFT_290854 [Schizophyllum commune]
MHGRDCEELSASQRSGDTMNNDTKGEPPDTAAQAARNVESRPAALRQFPNPATNCLLPSSFKPRPFWRQTRVSSSTRIVEDYDGRLLDGRQQRLRFVPNMARSSRRLESGAKRRGRTLNQCAGSRTELKPTDEGHPGDKPR